MHATIVKLWATYCFSVKMERSLAKIRKGGCVFIDANDHDLPLSNSHANEIGMAMFHPKTPIISLNICNHYIGGSGINTIAYAISETKNFGELLLLDLQGNILKCIGAKSIVSAITDHPSLQTLNMSRCHIWEEGAVAVATCLETIKTLKYLYLSNNDFHDRGAWAFSRALPKSKLVILDIYGNNMGKAAGKAISDSVALTPTLCVLHTSINYAY